MSYKVTDEIIMKDAHIVFRNFSGEESKFNRKGNRSFDVVIEDREVANKLMEDGWNVKQFASSRDENEEPGYHLNVCVSFDRIPPKVIMVSGNNQCPLDEDSISTLDFAEILKVDLVIRPYNWEVNGKSGVKAYLKTMYVTIDKDPFEDEYR